MIPRFWKWWEFDKDGQTDKTALIIYQVDNSEKLHWCNKTHHLSEMQFRFHVQAIRSF